MQSCANADTKAVCLQVAIAKHGLQTLLSINYYFTEVLSQRGMSDLQLEQKLVWLCGGILSNIALHPNNRSALHSLTDMWLDSDGPDCAASKHRRSALSGNI